MSDRKIVHVIGTGTIGEPLIGLLSAKREQLGIDEVTFHKRTPLYTDRSKVFGLFSRGAKLAVDADRRADFKDMEMEPAFTAEDALERASVVIDCTPAGNENKEKRYLDFVSTTKGFIAQGSESGFGKPYARGINDAALKPGEDKFLQVVSCNTHNMAAVLDTFVHRIHGPESLESARFLCMRRANDVSQDAAFIPSPESGEHKDEKFGTHHARDVHRLYDTLGMEPNNIFSSAVKLNTQYMHLIWFDVRLNQPTSREQLLETIQQNDRLAVTYKQSMSQVFSFGRDHGHYGRILNQAVFCLPTLAVAREGHEIVGTCFTPQDGNSLLSSVAGALWFLFPNDYDDRIQALREFFFHEV